MAAQASSDALAKLYLQYHARLSPRSPCFIWPNTLGLLGAQSMLADALFNDASSSSDEYDRAFLKHLVKHIDEAIETCSDEELAMLETERQDLVVNDALLERYMQLVIQPEAASVCGVRTPPTLLVRHFVPVTGQSLNPILGPCKSVQLHQDGLSISQGTTGLTTWEASLCLAAYLAGSPHIVFEQQCILEIGSGTDSIRNIHIESLDWLEVSSRNPAVLAQLQRIRPTCVLAADVVYDPSLVPALADTLHAALHTNSDAKPFALVASTVRNPTTYETFLQALQKRHMAWKQLEVEFPMWPNTDLRLFPSTHCAEMEGSVALIRIELS